MDREQRDKILDGMVDRMRFLHAVWDLGEVVKKYELYDALKKTGVAVDDFAYLLVATMSFLMSQGIHDREQETSTNEVRSFLLSMPELGINQRNVDVLLRYIVNVSLQNEGVLRSHKVFDARRGEKTRVIAKMLVKGFDGVRLDEDGYDILFRSREYADMYDFDARKTLLLLSLDNRDFARGKRESLELLNIAMSALKRSEGFQARVRADVLSAEPGDYEKYRALADNAKGTRKQLGMLQKELQRPIEDLVEGADAFAVEVRDKQSRDIACILDNVRRTISVLEETERVVTTFVKEHEDLIVKSMSIERRRGVDMRKTFLLGALNLGVEGMLDAFDFVFERLHMPGTGALPTPSRIFGMSVPATLSGDREEEEFESEPVYVDEEDEKAYARRKAVEFARIFLPWLKEARKARLSEFVAEAKDDELAALTENKAMPNILLDLYRVGATPLPTERGREVDQEDGAVEENNYERLFRLSETAFEPGEHMRLTATDEEVSWSCLYGDERLDVRMTDFECEVVTI